MHSYSRIAVPCKVVYYLANNTSFYDCDYMKMGIMQGWRQLQ